MRRRIVALAGQPELWLGVLLVWIALSALRSWHTPWMRTAGTEALRWGAGITLALAISRGLPRIPFAAQAVTALLGSLVAAILLCGLGPSGRATGPYGDHQLCASALLVLLPFTLAVALAADAPRWRWGGQIVSLAAVLCLALTQTRSAWLGATVAALVFTAQWVSRPQVSPDARRRFRLIPALLALGVAASFALLVGISEAGQPLASRAGTLRAVGQDASWQGRLSIWRDAIPMAFSHPVAGWGLGRYPFLQWRWTHVGHPLLPTERPSLSEQAHDLYLQTLIEMGGVGLILYLAALAATATRCRRALRADDAPRWRLPQALQVATVSLLAGQGVDALASPSYQFAEISLLFWAVLGVGMAAARPAAQEESAWALPATASRFLRVCAVGGTAVALVALAVPVGLLPPVEAYNPGPGLVYQNQIRISPQSATVAAGQTQQYLLQALYETSSGTMIWEDVNNATSPNTFFGVTGPPGHMISSTITPYGLFTAGAGDAGATGFKVSGTFQPNYSTGPLTASTPVTVTN